MITTITLNPSIDKTIYVTKLTCNDTNRISNVEIDAGGKGINCSRMLKELDAETRAIAFLGGKTGDFIRLVLDKAGIPIDYVETERPTRINICVEETSGAPPTTLNERGGPVEHRELVDLFEKVKDASRESSYVVLGGSVPLGINQDVYKVLIQIVKAGGAKAVLDADGEALIDGMKARPFMIKPNRDEAERLLEKEFESKTDVARAALELSERGIELVIISLGKQGAIACYEGAVYDVGSPDIKPNSSIGSGDSFIAGVLYGLEKKLPIEEALRFGSAAGAATALSDGSDIGKKDDVDRLVSQIKVAKVAIV